MASTPARRLTLARYASMATATTADGGDGATTDRSREDPLERYATGAADVAAPSTARPSGARSPRPPPAPGRRARSSTTWPTASRWPTSGCAGSSPRTTRSSRATTSPNGRAASTTTARSRRRSRSSRPSAAASLQLLRTLTAEEWARTGTHSESGRLLGRRAGWIYAEHCTSTPTRSGAPAAARTDGRPTTPTPCRAARRPAILPDVVDVRRRLHRRPERGLQLPETQAVVVEALRALGARAAPGRHDDLGGGRHRWRPSRTDDPAARRHGRAAAPGGHRARLRVRGRRA